MIDAAFEQLEPLVGTRRACEALGRSRASHYRHLRGPRPGPPKPRPTPPNALTPQEREAVLEVLHGEQFEDPGWAGEKGYFTVDLPDEIVAEAASLDTYRGRLSVGRTFDNGVDFLLSGTIGDSDGHRRLYYPEFDDLIALISLAWSRRGWVVT